MPESVPEHFNLQLCKTGSEKNCFRKFRDGVTQKIPFVLLDWVLNNGTGRYRSP
jgi:hypothetical protein